jgi:hypothetical protein
VRRVVSDQRSAERVERDAGEGQGGGAHGALAGRRLRNIHEVERDRDRPGLVPLDVELVSRERAGEAQRVETPLRETPRADLATLESGAEFESALYR